MAGTIKVASWGGDGGNEWDMGPVAARTRLLDIVIYHGDNIDSINYRYEVDGISQWSGVKGGTGGHQSKINFEDGEYLTAVRGTSDEFVRSLTLVSNKRTYGPFGVMEEGTPFSLSLCDGRIVGFYGRDGYYIDAIGVYLAPN